MFLNALIEVLASIPDIVCIAQTTLIVVNNPLLVYVRPVPFFCLIACPIFRLVYMGRISLPFLRLNSSSQIFARNWPVSDPWMVTLFLQALHLRYILVWKLDRDFKILRKCLIYEIFFTKELKLTLNKQSLDIFTPQVYLCKYISFVFSTTYTMISFRSKRRFLSLVFILKIVPKQLLASGSVNIDEYLPLLFNKL